MICDDICSRVAAEEMPGEQHTSNCDGRICDIERWPVECADVKIKEVYYIPVPKPVDQIAAGAAKNQATAP